jgi:excisionase family DNA binding protein
MRQITSRPQLLTVAQAALLLNVSEKTVRRWVDDEKVPHVRLPGGQIRIPLAALLASLQGNYDLAGEVAELDGRFSGLTEDAVRAALDDPPGS